MLSANQLIKVMDLGTQLPGHKLIGPARQLHEVKASVQPGTAQHLPDSKFTPHSAVSQWLELLSLTEPRLWAGVLRSSFALHAHTQQQNLSIYISLCYPKKGQVSTEALCSIENIKLKSTQVSTKSWFKISMHNHTHISFNILNDLY